MRGERRLLRLGEYLVRRASLQLPHDIREERYQEWAGELPAILRDPQTRPAPRRALRMLCYASDTVRGAAMTPVRSRRWALRTTALSLLLVVDLAVVAWNTWATVEAPGHPLKYLQLAYGLLIAAWPVSILLRSAPRVTVLIVVSSTMAGLAVYLWNASQAPADWVNYFLAGLFGFLTLLLLVLLALLFVIRWASGNHGEGPGKHVRPKPQQSGE
jgi:hypothetical protein